MQTPHFKPFSKTLRHSTVKLFIGTLIVRVVMIVTATPRRLLSADHNNIPIVTNRKARGCYLLLIRQPGYSRLNTKQEPISARATQPIGSNVTILKLHWAKFLFLKPFFALRSTEWPPTLAWNYLQHDNFSFVHVLCFARPLSSSLFLYDFS